MKRVVFFARDLEIGGVERALVNLCGALAESCEVTLVLQERRGALLPELDARVRVRTMPRARLPAGWLRRAGNALLLALWAARHAGCYDFSCAYCTYLVSGARLARLVSRSSCLYVHNDYSLIYPERADFEAFFRALGAARYRRLLFVSNESREAFAARLPALREKTHVLGNLLGAERLYRLAEQPCPFRRKEGETVFLFLGRLEEEQKRLSRLLEAFRLARERRGDLLLLLVGDGPARADCETWVKTHKAGAFVRLCGAQRNPYPWLMAADCLVLASDYEGFPVVCCEALALGRGVISTIPVSDERIDLRDRAVICEKSAEALAAAMAAWTPQTREKLDAAELDRQRLAALRSLF